jgi:hypothetical protein
MNPIKGTFRSLTKPFTQNDIHMMYMNGLYLQDFIPDKAIGIMQSEKIYFKAQ